MLVKAEITDKGLLLIAAATEERINQLFYLSLGTRMELLPGETVILNPRITDYGDLFPIKIIPVERHE